MPEKISKLYKALICGGEISLAVLDSTALVQEAITRHNLSPVAAAALGRTLSAATYLCSWLKSEDSTLSVTVDGNGAGGKICVSGEGNLHLRGYAERPEVTLPLRADGKLDVGGYVGKNGFLTVSSDNGEGIPFVGTSALVSGEIAEDFSAYFLTSEQRPTAIALGVRVTDKQVCKGAGGVFLQPLPNASEESITFAEKTIGAFSNISALIETEGAEAILKKLGVLEYSGKDVSFSCRCSEERARRAVLSLGKADAQSLLCEEGVIRVHCHDCNTDYTFDKEDIEALFD